LSAKPGSRERLTVRKVVSHAAVALWFVQDGSFGRTEAYLSISERGMRLV
jgi:hypothetical protein